MSKSLKFVGYVVLSLLLLAALLVAILYFSAQPKTSGTVAVAELKKAVTIYRDQYGVPHIEADNDEDAFFALGYIHAEDRLWQMEFQRHIAQGTLSEMFGQATLNQDKYLRTLGFYRAATTAWPALSLHAKRMFHSYTNGINSFLQTGKLPLQFTLINYKPKPWTDVDSIAWQKMMAWDLQSTWKEKIQNYMIKTQLGGDQIPLLLPPYPDNAPTVMSDENVRQSGLALNQLTLREQTLTKTSLPSVASLTSIIQQSDAMKISLGLVDVPGKGSNNWVISGRLTKNNKPLLASDPHLGLSAPSLWYLADIKTPNFHVIGATIPGLPVMIIGRNDYIAWGITNACVDTQDLYVESTDTELMTRYENIRVKNEDDVIYPVRSSAHGPIISDITDAGKLDKLIALKWTAFMPGDTSIQSFFELSYARNWNEFKNALRHYVVPSQNFVYADTEGNIGYYLPGKIPIRDGWNGMFPVNGQANEEWKGFIPFEKLPHVYNPQEGYIVSANNKIVTNTYPYSLTFRCGIAPYRAERITELIKNNRALTRVDVEKIQNDTVSYLWRDLRTTLLKTTPLDEASQNILNKLQVWNGDMHVGSEEATIFSYWYRNLRKLMPEDLMTFSEGTDPLFIKQQLSSNGPYCRTKNTKDCQQFLSQSLQDTATKLNKIPSHRWKWGDIHAATFEELGLGGVNYLGWIWNRKTPTPGDAYTINVGSYDVATLNQIEGAGYRQIIDFNDFNDSRYVITLGQSENVLTAHYQDQMHLWSKGQYLKMSSNKEDWGRFSMLTLVPHG
jgi:penicillin G amidase